VGYLRERQSTVDYVTVERLATTLATLFWADLEHHHPGIDSLRLTPEIAAAWKQRVLIGESGLSTLSTLRACYLDIAQWAMEEPAQWGPWAAPCPIRAEEMSPTKPHRRRKSRMDQRTRERLPVLPGLVTVVNTQRRTAADLLAAAQAAPPGEVFYAAGHTLRRTQLARPADAAKTWAQGPRHRHPPRPHPRRTPSVLGLGRRRGAAAHRPACRGTLRTLASQLRAIHSAQHRRTDRRCCTSPRPKPTPNGCW